MIILFKLLIAHLFTDFIIQPGKWVKDKFEKKHKSPYLYLHVILTGLAVYILLGDFKQWVVPVFIAATHFFIDLWKLQKQDNLVYFLIDQLLHLVVIGLAFIYINDQLPEAYKAIKQLSDDPKTLILITAYITIIWPVGFIIGKATAKWRKEIEDLTPEEDTLSEAGKWIGIFERLLVLTFVLTNQYPSIGFLIAAKSILRFGDKSTVVQRKQTEYVLVGTLMSFTIAIFIGLLANKLLR